MARCFERYQNMAVFVQPDDFDADVVVRFLRREWN